MLAIGPAANWRGKQWRAERFAELARRLTGRERAAWRAPGSRCSRQAHERAQAEPLLAAMPERRRIDLVGRLDLLTAAAVLRRCALFIGNDTGLMHIAAAVGHADPRPVRSEPGRAIRALGLLEPPWCARADPPETMFPPGFDHRTTDTLMDSLSVDAVEAAARRLWHALPERGGVSDAAAALAAEARSAAGPRLSALVVAHNEEAQLAGCLAGLGFADEIVVLLDRCTDGSREIARRFTDRIVEGAWEREGPRRQAGIAACRGDWIFEIDADERVSPELAAEIRACRRKFAGGLASDPGRQLCRRSAGAVGLGRVFRQIGLCRAVPQGRQALERRPRAASRA